MIRVLAVLSLVGLSALVPVSGPRAAASETVYVDLSIRSSEGAVRLITNHGEKRCTSSCRVRNIVRGERVTLVAERGVAADFRRWEGACSSYSQRTCEFYASADVTGVTAWYWQRLWYPVFGGGRVIVESLQPRRSCGVVGCRDLAYGDRVVLRPRAFAGYRFAGWGSKCEAIRSDCEFTMRNNYTAAATFEPIPPPRDLPEGVTEDPVTGWLDSVVSVRGKGMVVVTGMAHRRATVCDAMVRTPAENTCVATRPERKYVIVRAIAAPGARLLYWSDRCRPYGANTECRFYNASGPNGRPRITATFG